MQFLIYTCTDGKKTWEEVVALEDISSIVLDTEGMEVQSLISIRSDPQTECVAQGTPLEVVQGKVIER